MLYKDCWSPPAPPPLWSRLVTEVCLESASDVGREGDFLEKTRWKKDSPKSPTLLRGLLREKAKEGVWGWEEGVPWGVPLPLLTLPTST